MVIDVLNELKSTSSRNKKLEILQSNINNPILKELLYLTYHPHKMFYINKVKPTEFGEKTIEETFDSWKNILEKLHSREITGNRAKQIVVNFLNTCNKDTQNIYLHMLSKKLPKLGVNIKTLNKCGFNIPESIAQLAEEINVERIDTYEKEYYKSLKLNGMRCVYLANDDVLLTKNGHLFVGFDHIKEECQQIAKKYNLILLDGELYNHKLKFEAIQSIARTTKNVDENVKKLLTYHVFALDGKNIDNTDTMVQLLQEITDEAVKSYKYITPLQQEKIVLDLENIVIYYLNAIEYEGIVLRHPTIHYAYKRSRELLKVKHFTMLDIVRNPDLMKQLSDTTRQKLLNYKESTEHVIDDYIIIDFIEGKGEFKNMLGALIAEHKTTKHRIKVGTGFTLDMRKEIWENQEKYLGKEIIVKFQEYTRYNNLAFPVFEGVKLY